MAKKGGMSEDKCRNEGCGAYFVSIPTGCMFKEDYQVTACVNFTRTQTVSITKDRLNELEGIARHGDMVERQLLADQQRLVDLLKVCEVEGKSGGWLEDSPLAEQINRRLKHGEK